MNAPIIVDGDNFGVMFVAPKEPRSDEFWTATSTVGARLALRFLKANFGAHTATQVLSPCFYHDEGALFVRHLDFFDEVLRLKDQPSQRLRGRILKPPLTEPRVEAKVYLERDAHLAESKLHGVPPMATRESKVGFQPGVTCDHYVRIDSPVLAQQYLFADVKRKWSDWQTQGADIDVRPQHSAIAVLSVKRLAPEYPMRVNSSYEAMAVDVLRWLTGLPGGAGSKRAGTTWRDQLFPRADKLPSTACFAAVRLASDAVLLYRDSPQEAYLYYDNRRPQPVHIACQGRMTGYATVLASCLAAHLHGASSVPTCNELDCAIKLGLACNQALFALGHCKPDDKLAMEDWAEQFDTHFDGRLKQIHQIALKGVEEIRRVKINIPSACSHRKFWTILETAIATNGAATGRRPSYAPNQYLDSAIAILSGTREVADWEIRCLPLLNYGKLTLVERFEIEDYLAVHHAFFQYADEPPERPLNVAVFGPPGSGKSFGVKQVAKKMAESGKPFDTQSLTFNVSQFRGVEDLVKALHLVRDRCLVRDPSLQQKIPLVFFDEFDCSLAGQPFGWLKYFLAPMEDSTFTADGNVFHLGKCVLVFAGGVNRNFSEMNGRLRNPSFCEAKGPDFISRLRVSLNIQGIDKPEGEDDGGRFYLRRAVLLREILTKKHMDAGAQLPAPIMTESLARAFLKVEGFKHGVRSLRAIIDMSNFRPGQPLSPSVLPPRDQLAMHVDARRFRELVGTKA